MSSALRYELHGVEYPGRARSVWRFGEPGCPLRLAKTPAGIGGAPLSHIRQSNARQDGATWRGLSREINPIGLSVRIGPVEPGAVAMDLWQTWRDSLGDGRAVAEFHVISPGGADRFQWVRREQAIPDPDFALLDTIGWCTEEAVLTSDESWWRGEVAHLGPLDNTQWSGRTLRNDGDTAGWVLWALTGPGTYTIGVDGEAVTLPALTAGQTLSVETNPEYPHIRNGAGVDVWETAGMVGWYKPIPARTTVPLTMSATGTSSASRIELWMPQLHERAAA